MLLRCCSILIIFVLTTIAQASLLGNSKSYVSTLDRLQLDNEMRKGESLLRSILERTSEFDSVDRLTEPLRTKRCRWKLCGTGRRFRYVR